MAFTSAANASRWGWTKNSMPIIKNQTSNFVSVPNSSARDKRLSIETRGVLAFILSHKEDFDLSAEYLQKELDLGRDKVKKIIRELKENGYLNMEAAHNKKGNFSGQKWTVYAESQNQNFNTYRPTEKPSDGYTDGRVDRQTENTSDNKRKSSPKENKEEDLKENLSLSARAIHVDEVLEISTVHIDEISSRAVEIYREVFPTYTLDGQQLDDFVKALPEVDESVWRQTVFDWRLSRYKASNIAGLISRYRKDLKEKQNGTFSNENDRGAQTEKQIKSSQRLDALISDAGRFQAPKIN